MCFGSKTHTMLQNKYEYDAFISHAVEDKIPIANELCAKLEAAGLKIWYSGKELGVGDSIEKTIEKGLNRSRYGIVVFSPTYLAKNWTIREFYTLLAKEIEEHKVILPVLYNVSLDDLKKKDMLMADRFAVNADKGIDFVVERLVREIKKPDVVKLTRRPWLSSIGFLLMVSLLANVALLSKAIVAPQSSSKSSEKFDPVSLRSSPAQAEELLDEMQGLFARMNGCDCPNRKSLRRDTATMQHDVSNVKANARAGRKMTMAVIFRIETGDNLPTEADSEGINPVTDLDRNDDPDAPFVTVKNRELLSGGNKTACLSTTTIAE